MPDASSLLSMPILLRKMLNFDFASKFELKVSHQAVTSHNFYVTGATRSGTFTYKVKTTGGAGAVESWYPLNDVPIWVSVMDIDDDFGKGNLYVQVWLEINDNPVQSLCSGYVGEDTAISYPMTQNEQMSPAHNWTYSYSGANPAAGAECLITVPTGELWHIKSVNATLVTDATVSDRYVKWLFKTGTRVVGASMSSTSQSASLTRQYAAYAAPYFAPVTFGTIITQPIPMDLWISAGDTIESSTTNLQAGDNFAAPVVDYRQYQAL
jgi:hypothetical protein